MAAGARRGSPRLDEGVVPRRVPAGLRVFVSAGWWPGRGRTGPAGGRLQLQQASLPQVIQDGLDHIGSDLVQGGGRPRQEVATFPCCRGPGQPPVIVGPAWTSHDLSPHPRRFHPETAEHRLKLGFADEPSFSADLTINHSRANFLAMLEHYRRVSQQNPSFLTVILSRTSLAAGPMTRRLPAVHAACHQRPDRCLCARLRRS